MNIAATVEFWMNVDLNGSACVWLDGSEVTEEDVCVSSAGGWDVSPPPSTSNTICSVSDGCFSDGLSLSWLDAPTRKRQRLNIENKRLISSTQKQICQPMVSCPEKSLYWPQATALKWTSHKQTATGRPSRPLPLRCWTPTQWLSMVRVSCDDHQWRIHWEFYWPIV